MPCIRKLARPTLRTCSPSLSLFCRKPCGLPWMSALHTLLNVICMIALTVLELLRNAKLHSIIRLRCLEDHTHQPQHVHDLVWRLPLIRAQHTQTHGAALIVGHVGVVDFGAEGEGRWLKGVFFREGDLDVEFAALEECQCVD